MAQAVRNLEVVDSLEVTVHRSSFGSSPPMSQTTSPAHSVCDLDVPEQHSSLLPQGSTDFELDDKGEYLSDNLHRTTPD